MMRWSVLIRETAGQEFYEVIKIQNSDKEVLRDTNIKRFGSMGLFGSLKEAMTIADGLNSAEH